jgi:hypothetical protein
MTQNLKTLSKFSAALFALVVGSNLAQSQVFTFTNNDLILGFRKNAPYTENYEAVVDIGQAITYINQAVGTTVTVPGFSASQLSPGSFATLDNLSWSVSGAYNGNAYSGYVNNTLWVTVPRTDNAVRSVDPVRLGYNVQGAVKAKIVSIPGTAGGAGWVSRDLGTASQFNTATFVREALQTYSSHVLSVWMRSTVDPTIGTLNDTWPTSQPNAGNIENTTPGGFSGAVRSDLYEVRPLATAGGVPVVDPHTGTSGLAWYIGYFELSSTGTLRFKRENGTTTRVPPPPPSLSISRSGSLNTISFVSSNTATYKLFFTNSAGLKAPVTNWPSPSGTITGDGTTKSFQDTTADSDRFYRVQGQ